MSFAAAGAVAVMMRAAVVMMMVLAGVAGERLQKKHVMDVHPRDAFNRTLVFGAPISYALEDAFFAVSAAS